MNDFINPGLILSRNGDSAIQLIESGKFTMLHSGLKDLSTVNEMFQFDQDRIHLGMLYTFDSLGTRLSRQNYVPSFLLNMLRNKAVINLLDGYSSFTYSTPIQTYNSLRIMKTTDPSECTDRPGLGGSMFPIYLNRALRQGDLLTYDIEDGIQLTVTEDLDIVPVGEMFKHWVKISNGDGTLYFPLDKLIAGTEYYKFSHTMGEFSEEYSEFWSEFENQELIQEFTLGNHMGVSTKTTLYGGERALAGTSAGTKQILDKIQQDVNMFQTSTNRPYDSLILINNYVEGETITPQGFNVDLNQDTVMSLFEAMAVAELTRLEVANMIWAKEAFIQEINGHKRVNEGVYQQFRRGNIFSYPIPGGVDIPFLQRISGAIYRHNIDMDIRERRIHFTVGQGLAENLDWIVQNLGLSQLNEPVFRSLFGNSSVIPGQAVTGPLDGLSISELRFREDGVYIPGVGRITWTHDPSFDYTAGNSRLNNKVIYQGGRSRTTYSGYVDVRDTSATNVFTDPNLRRASFMDEEGLQMMPTSVFYVKPRQSLHWGWEQGRMNTVSNLMRELSRISSVKQMTTEFWMHVRSAAWVGDKSAIFLIELEKPCMTTI